MTKYDEQSAQTRENLTQAFWRLYVSTPIKHITVSQVAEAAGYHRATFYLHFHDVYEVLENIEAQLLADVEACVATCMAQLDAGGDAEAAMQPVLALYEDNRERFTILLGSHGDPAFTEQLKEQLKPLWRRYVLHDTKPRSDDERDLVLEYTLSGALFMVSRWLENPHGVTPEALLHLLYHKALGR